MSIDWEKVKQKAVDIAIDGGKSFVKEAEKKTRSIEKAAERKAKQEGRTLSDEAYEKLDDMYDSIDNAYETMLDFEERYHSRFKEIREDDSYYEDDEYYDEYCDDQYEPVDYENTDNNLAESFSIKLTEEELKIKADKQTNSSSKTFELDQNDIMKTENKWCSLGKMSSIETDLISTDVAGLLRLRVDGQVVYIVRVIEIKSGGFNKKVTDLKNFSTIGNRKLRDMICKNLNSIDIEILNVGKTSEDVDYVRSLEKEMIKKYKPSWN